MSKQHFEIGDVIGTDTPLPQTHAHLAGWVVFNTNPITHEASIIEPPSPLIGSWRQAHDYLNHPKAQGAHLPTEEDAFALKNAFAALPDFKDKIGVTDADHIPFWGTKNLDQGGKLDDRLYYFNTISLSPEPHPQRDVGYIRTVQEISPDLIFQ